MTAVTSKARNISASPTLRRRQLRQCQCRASGGTPPGLHRVFAGHSPSSAGPPGPGEDPGTAPGVDAGEVSGEASGASCPPPARASAHVFVPRNPFNGLNGTAIERLERGGHSISSRSLRMQLVLAHGVGRQPPGVLSAILMHRCSAWLPQKHCLQVTTRCPCIAQPLPGFRRASAVSLPGLCRSSAGPPGPGEGPGTATGIDASEVSGEASSVVSGEALGARCPP